MRELVLDTAQIGSIVFVRTTKRIVVAHESRIPLPRPSKQRLDELRAWGWTMHQIARMYGTDMRNLYPNG